MRFIKASIATLFSLVVIFPIIYTISASFFTYADFTSIPAKLLPSSFYLENYVRAFAETSLARFLANSFVTATLGMLLRMGISIGAAYAFTFFTFKGRDLLFFVVIATMLLPSDALILANYSTIRTLGLTDTYLGIISTKLLSPTHIFMLRQYFKTMSREYREAALIEGCSDARFITTLLLPISKAVVITLGIHSFSNIFNDYLWPLLVTNKEGMRTVQVGLTMLGFSENLDYGPQFAAIALLMIPIVIAFIIMHSPIQNSVSSRFAGR
ncbi:carbohydrate ABC transporter permease [uncultured Sphaerochaeta sp.]|uniref:carbohydrate ABC transporter permease n=1 Tax=uncultured Sphaerochaeta sp. TaxID=886478 RepID=UPI002AA911DD|nr:carbohydrate ABC transporter permease [uncultured Sphaerochaeta sp.]